MGMMGGCNHACVQGLGRAAQSSPTRMAGVAIAAGLRYYWAQHHLPAP